MKLKTDRDDKASTSDTLLSKGPNRKRTLKELEVGDVAYIVDFSDHNDIAKKIEAMGLRRGKKVVVLQRLGRGILVKTSNSRIVLTSDLAKNIEIK